MAKYLTWNSCRGLENAARATLSTLAEAMVYTTAAGGPNRITSAPDGEEWILGAYPDRAPQWFGPYDVDSLPYEANRPGDADHALNPNRHEPLAPIDYSCGRGGAHSLDCGCENCQAARTRDGAI